MSGSISGLRRLEGVLVQEQHGLLLLFGGDGSKTFLPSGNQRLLRTKPPTTLATWPSSRFRWPINWP